MQATETINCTFSGAQGFRLDARIDVPKDRQADQFAVIGHCFTCTKETLTTFRVSRGLAQRGIAVLRFDFTGLGNSEGVFADTNFSTMVDDMLCAADYLQQHYRAPATLIGHSMGGTAALLASTRLESCSRVVTIASPSEPSHVLHHFGNAMERLAAGKDAHIRVAGVDYPVKQQFVDNVRTYHMDQLMAAYDKPILSIRAGQDTLVDDQDAEEIIAYGNEQSRLLDLPNADHLFSNRQDTDKIIDAIADWIVGRNF